MASELLANNFATQLSVGCAIGDATIQVAAAAPAALQGGQFRILVDSEYMLVTGGQSGTTWNVTRGVEGSAAAQHLQGVWVTHLLTAGALFGGNLASVANVSSGSSNALPYFYLPAPTGSAVIDTPAIQAVQAAARAAHVPMVWQSGAYLSNAPLTVASGEHWIGQGWDPDVFSTTLTFAFAADARCIAPATPSAPTFNVTIEEMVIQGSSTHETVGIFAQTARDWHLKHVWMRNFTQWCLYLYGQRDATGTITGAYAGDTTKVFVEHCEFIATGSVANTGCVRLGGTNTTDASGAALTATTITTDSGTTVTVADGTKIIGSTGTIICADNGEQINFTGKSGNNLTGCTRAINGTTQIVHSAATGISSKANWGQTNMCVFEKCTASGGNNTWWHETGTSNVCVGVGVGSALTRGTGNPGDGDGVRFSSPSNMWLGGVSESNGQWGFNFDGFSQTFNNYVIGVNDGGTNGLGFGFMNDVTGNNYDLTSDGGLRLSLNTLGTGSLRANTLFAMLDGLPRWTDSQGGARPAFAYKHSSLTPPTSIASGAVTTFDAANLGNFNPATIDIWEAEIVNSIGGQSGTNLQFVDVYDATAGAQLTTPTGLGGVAVLSGGSMADNSYFGKLTAVNQFGETVASAQVGPVTITGGGGLGSINWSWTQVVSAGITGYRLYVGTASGAENNYFAIPGGATITFTQTQNPASGTSSVPPTTDRSGNVYSYSGTLKRNSNGTTLQSVAGLGTHRLQFRVFNPTTGAVTLTGRICWSLRTI